MPHTPEEREEHEWERRDFDTWLSHVLIDISERVRRRAAGPPPSGRPRDLADMAEVVRAIFELTPMQQRAALIGEVVMQCLNKGTDARNMLSEVLDQNVLTLDKYSTIIGERKHKSEEETQGNMTEGIEELKCDFRNRHTFYIDLDSKRISLHHCKWDDCQKTFYSFTGTPEKCPHCKKRHWQYGKYLWDLRKERNHKDKRESDSPDDTT